MVQTASEEQRIVEFTIKQLKQNPTLNEECLRELLIKNAMSLKCTKRFNALAKKSIAHYLHVGRMFVRLGDLIDQKADGSETWTADEYQRLISTGILLCNKAGQIYKLADQSFLTVLKTVSSALPMSKPRLDPYVQAEIDKIDDSEIEPGQHDAHNRIRDNVAIPFLRNLGCRFISKEVELEKAGELIRGLKIDALGWKSDGTICGIEVKMQADDDKKAKKKMRIDGYIRYCNEFYILTTDEKIFKDTKEWRNKKRYNEMGILLYSNDIQKIVRIENPREPKREVTSAMLLRMQDAFLTKFIKLAGTVCFESKDNTPDLAIKKMNSALSLEFINFGDSEDFKMPSLFEEKSRESGERITEGG